MKTNYRNQISYAWWLTPVTLVLWRLRQEDSDKFRAILGFRVILRQLRLQSETPSQNKVKQNKTKPPLQGNTLGLMNQMCSQKTTYIASDLLHLTVFNKTNGKSPISETIIKALPCMKITSVTLSLNYKYKLYLRQNLPNST